MTLHSTQLTCYGKLKIYTEGNRTVAKEMVKVDANGKEIASELIDFNAKSKPRPKRKKIQEANKDGETLFDTEKYRASTTRFLG